MPKLILSEENRNPERLKFGYETNIRFQIRAQTVLSSTSSDCHTLFARGRLTVLFCFDGFKWLISRHSSVIKCKPLIHYVTKRSFFLPREFDTYPLN